MHRPIQLLLAVSVLAVLLVALAGPDMATTLVAGGLGGLLIIEVDYQLGD